MAETVECPKCSAENAPGQRFCGNCGNALERECRVCGSQNSLSFRYCGNCGNPLEDSEAPKPLREERRWATVVFADLSGFTSASEGMDPEDVRAMVDHCMNKLGEVVERFGGYTEKIVGDELMALFGVRTAHGDDAERAVRAALEMQKCREENRATFGELELHVGINTGEMMFAPVGPGESRDFTVMGDAVNVASRLTSAASGSSVLVGEETYRATRRAIAYQEMAPLKAKGKSEPVRSWLAVRPLAAPAERPVSAVRLVGRDGEYSLLISVWERVKGERRPHLVTVIGPPGIGKTRLSRELTNKVLEDDGLVLSGRSLPYGEMTGYGAFVQQIKKLAGVLETDSAAEAKRKLDLTLAEVLGTSDERGSAEALEMIVGLEANGIAPDQPAILLAARRFVESVGAEQPTLLLFEDIHWADPSLLALIQTLGARIRDTRVLILCLARPELLETKRDWGAGLPAYVALPLDPLSGEESKQLARLLLTNRPEFSAEAEEIVGKAGGNPLFIEEMSASIAEGGLGRAKELPSGVKEIIAARLDALPPGERQTLLEASVVGKVFWQGALERLGEGREITPILDSLEARDFIRREPRSQLSGDEEFTFKHMLIREVAYATLPKARRKEAHATVARFIEEASSDRSDESASLLAHHHREAGAVDKAIGYLIIAAERASRSWAKGESLRLYEDALRLLPPDDAARRNPIELATSLLRVDMGDYAAAQQTLEGLVPRLEGRDLGVALIAQTKSAYWQTDAAGAKAGAARAQRVIEELNDPSLKVLLHKELMNTRSMDGDFASLWKHAEIAIENWPPGQMPNDLAGLHAAIANWHNIQGDFSEVLEPARRAYEMGLDLQLLEPLMVGGSAVGSALTGLNRPEEAVSFWEALIEKSREIEVAPRMTGRALNMMAGTLREMFDLDAAREHNLEAIELGHRAAFPNAVLQGKTDLIFLDLAAGSIGAARAALPEMFGEIQTLSGWHEWLVRGRLRQAAADAALLAGDLEEAAEAALASIEEARDRRRKYEALARITYASALSGMGKIDEARSECRAASTLAEGMGHSPTGWKCLGALARLEYEAGNDDAAAEAHRRAVSLIDGYASALSTKHRDGFLAAREVTEILDLAK